MIAIIRWRCSFVSVGQSWRSSASCGSDSGAFGVNFSEESTFPRVFDGSSIPVSPIINEFKSLRHFASNPFFSNIANSEKGTIWEKHCQFKPHLHEIQLPNHLTNFFYFRRPIG